MEKLSDIIQRTPQGRDNNSERKIRLMYFRKSITSRKISVGTVKFLKCNFDDVVVTPSFTKLVKFGGNAFEGLILQSLICSIIIKKFSHLIHVCVFVHNDCHLSLVSFRDKDKVKYSFMVSFLTTSNLCSTLLLRKPKLERS